MSAFTQHILDECQQIERLKQLLRRRSMQYQPDLKEEIARAKGLPPDAYFGLRYAEWAEIRNAYLAEATP